MNILKELKWSTIVSSVIYIGVGALLLFMPNTSLDIILNIIAIGTMVAGVLSLIRYFTFDAQDAFYRNDFLFGLIGFALGALIFLRKDIFASLIPLCLGIAILFSGFVKLQDAIDANRLGYQKSLAYIILAIINIVGGVLVILNPFTTNAVLFIIIGIGLIYSGVSDIVSTIYLSRRLNTLVKAIKDQVINVDVTEHKED